MAEIIGTDDKKVACKYCKREWLPCIPVNGGTRCYIWGVLEECIPVLTFWGSIRNFFGLSIERKTG